MHRSAPRLLSSLIVGSAVVLLWGIVPAEGYAWQYQSQFATTLRCSGDLISAGNNVARLVDRCGLPSSRFRTEAHTTEEPVYEYRRDGAKVKTGTRRIEHPAYETWTYSFGPGNYSYVIGVSDGGSITSIAQGRYGGLH